MKDVIRGFLKFDVTRNIRCFNCLTLTDLGFKSGRFLQLDVFGDRICGLGEDCKVKGVSSKIPLPNQSITIVGQCLTCMKSGEQIEFFFHDDCVMEHKEKTKHTIQTFDFEHYYEVESPIRCMPKDTSDLLKWFSRHNCPTDCLSLEDLKAQSLAQIFSAALVCMNISSLMGLTRKRLDSHFKWMGLDYLAEKDSFLKSHWERNWKYVELSRSIFLYFYKFDISPQKCIILDKVNRNLQQLIALQQQGNGPESCMLLESFFRNA